MTSLQENSPAGEDLPGAWSSDDMQAALMAGRMREELGLETAQLRIGLDVARNLLSRGARSEAMRVYVALVLCDPMEIDFQIGLANCASAIGEHYVALQAASAAVALAPRDPRGYLISGRSCLAIGNPLEAQQDLTDALAFADRSRDSAVIEEATLLLARLHAAMR